jgi:hypothetical protein
MSAVFPYIFGALTFIPGMDKSSITFGRSPVEAAIVKSIDVCSGSTAAIPTFPTDFQIGPEAELI